MCVYPIFLENRFKTDIGFDICNNLSTIQQHTLCNVFTGILK